MEATIFPSKRFLRTILSASAATLLLVGAAVLVTPPLVGQQQHHLHHAAAKLDINTATLTQLEAIPGLGPVYAKRIIAGRPYTSKRQLSTRGILPKDLYMQIKPRLIAHRPKKKP